MAILSRKKCMDILVVTWYDKKNCRMPMVNTKQVERLFERYRLMGDKPQRTTYTTVSKKVRTDRTWSHLVKLFVQSITTCILYTKSRSFSIIANSGMVKSFGQSPSILTFKSDLKQCWPLSMLKISADSLHYGLVLVQCVSEVSAVC